MLRLQYNAQIYCKHLLNELDLIPVLITGHWSGLMFAKIAVSIDTVSEGGLTMSAVRQDAWTDEDDLILAETTLRHIREGSTQLAAFDEVGEKIGRTGAACGFRWNSFVRKKHEEAIQIAKAQRQKRNHLRKNSVISASADLISLANFDEADVSGSIRQEHETNLSIDAVIRYLRQWKGTSSETTRRIRLLEKELHHKEQEIEKLTRENERLHKQVNEVESDYRVVNDDYKALIQIMDRARKMAILVEDNGEIRSRFKMDANGNLERIE